MRVPLRADRIDMWPYQFDSPEEELLVRLYLAGRIEIRMTFVAVQDGCMVLSVRRIEGVRPLIPH